MTLKLERKYFTIRKRIFRIKLKNEQNSEDQTFELSNNY